MSKYVKSTRRALSLLDRCLSMPQLKQIHSHLVVTGTLADPFAAGKLVAFCASTADDEGLRHADALFLPLPHRSAFIWNVMIRASVEKNQPHQALLRCKQMLRDRLFPNNYTFSFLIRACSSDLLSDRVSCSKMVHAQIIKLGWESYDFVQNGLIHLYSVCGSMDSARRLFNASSYSDVITWTAVINGYAKSGQVIVARQLFDEMPERNSVSWSAMITGYAQVELFKEALVLFNDMLCAGFRPNQAGIVGALTACAALGALDHGRWIHAYVDRNRMKLDRILGTALVDMYAKCGCIDMASSLFNELPHRDVFTFTALISCMANHSQSAGAVKLFRKMQKEGIVPNEVTFICVLSACSRMGLLDEGLEIFASMTNVYGIQPVVQHYGCLVDLLGRAGMLEEAKRVVREMPMEPDSYVLGALLNACRVRGAVELGEETVRSLAQRSLDHGGVHVLLSNIFASANQWDGVAKIRKVMEEKNIRKVPGCSAIEAGGVVREFVAGNKSRLLTGESMLMLLGIDQHLKSIFFGNEEVTLEEFNQ